MPFSRHAATARQTAARVQRFITSILAFTCRRHAPCWHLHGTPAPMAMNDTQQATATMSPAASQHDHPQSRDPLHMGLGPPSHTLLLQVACSLATSAPCRRREPRLSGCIRPAPRQDAVHYDKALCFHPKSAKEEKTHLPCEAHNPVFPRLSAAAWLRLGTRWFLACPIAPCLLSSSHTFLCAGCVRASPASGMQGNKARPSSLRMLTTLPRAHRERGSAVSMQ